MKIKVTDKFDFWEDNNTYTIYSHAINDISIDVFVNEIGVLIKDSPTVLIGTDESHIITFNREGKYTIVIDINGDITTYEVNHYPTLKENIILTMQKTLRDCASLDSISNTCKTSSTSIIAKHLYDFQMLANSANLYRDVLLSQDFIRNYTKAFMNVLNTKSYIFSTLLSNNYEVLDNTGNNISSIRNLRIYLAYLYILFYVIEMDALEYETGIDRINRGIHILPTDSLKVSTLKELFNFENLKLCFVELNINPIEVHNLIYDSYIEEIFGVL